MKDKHQKDVTRRHLIAGAGTAGALVAAAAVVQMQKADTAAPPPTAATPQHNGGYRLSEHVLRYYQTARV